VATQSWNYFECVAVSPKVGFPKQVLPPSSPSVALQEMQRGKRGEETSRSRPLIRKDYPLSLSISLSGGEETNQDFPSNGERTGKSPA
jgi:hypothetical protein